MAAYTVEIRIEVDAADPGAAIEAARKELADSGGTAGEVTAVFDEQWEEV